MGFLSNVFWLIVVLAIILGVVGLLSYNRLQALAQRLREAASNTEVAVSKKLSLVNQLIDLVRNYQEFEQFTHLKMSADNTDSLSQAMSQLRSSLGSFAIQYNKNGRQLVHTPDQQARRRASR